MKAQEQESDNGEEDLLVPNKLANPSTTRVDSAAASSILVDNDNECRPKGAPNANERGNDGVFFDWNQYTGVCGASFGIELLYNPYVQKKEPLSARQAKQ